MSLLGLVRTTLAVIIAVWVYQTVGEYSEGSPITWGGDHIAMTAACGSLFDLLQKFLVLTVAIACFEVAALLMIAFSGLLPCIICCLPCVACAGCFASLYYFVLSIVGIFTVYGIDKSQCADCQDFELKRKFIEAVCAQRYCIRYRSRYRSRVLPPLLIAQRAHSLRRRCTK
eukprot:TRINITY_DN5089_c0_g1_i3.p1 TRINITY_DN5089_c0_g1~~TRINITY_DN5089_c0_g1_i3.p1  ORF type:complete len:172 (-),score=8.48 TRINITY_DN5089_c0_g1_i3:112-627(-)